MMWSVFIDVLFGLAVAASVAALFSLVRADAFGRLASRHLGRDERANYRRNLLLSPGAAWVEPLLGGTGTDAHRRAVTYMRCVHVAALVFVVACIGAVAAGMLANGIKRGPSVVGGSPVAGPAARAA